MDAGALRNAKPFQRSLCAFQNHFDAHRASLGKIMPSKRSLVYSAAVRERGGEAWHALNERLGDDNLSQEERALEAERFFAALGDAETATSVAQALETARRRFTFAQMFAEPFVAAVDTFVGQQD